MFMTGDKSGFEIPHFLLPKVPSLYPRMPATTPLSLDSCTSRFHCGRIDGDCETMVSLQVLDNAHAGNYIISLGELCKWLAEQVYDLHPWIPNPKIPMSHKYLAGQVLHQRDGCSCLLTLPTQPLCVTRARKNASSCGFMRAGRRPRGRDIPRFLRIRGALCERRSCCWDRNQGCWDRKGRQGQGLF